MSFIDNHNLKYQINKNASLSVVLLLYYIIGGEKYLSILFSFIAFFHILSSGIKQGDPIKTIKNYMKSKSEGEEQMWLGFINLQTDGRQYLDKHALLTAIFSLLTIQEMIFGLMIPMFYKIDNQNWDYVNYGVVLLLALVMFSFKLGNSKSLLLSLLSFSIVYAIIRNYYFNLAILPGLDMGNLEGIFYLLLVISIIFTSTALIGQVSNNMVNLVL